MIRIVLLDSTGYGNISIFKIRNEIMMFSV
jgi:hypothetical protein